MRLTGFTAIEFAEKAGVTLNKMADNIDSPAVGLSIAEAEAIADDRPELIWLDVDAPNTTASREHGTRRRAHPAPAMGRAAARRVAAGQTSGAPVGRHAAGTPAGGLASGGLGGTNAGDGSPENAELDDAMGAVPVTTRATAPRTTSPRPAVAAARSAAPRPANAARRNSRYPSFCIVWLATARDRLCALLYL